MSENKEITDKMVSDIQEPIDGWDGLLETQAELQGISKEELQAQIMHQMFTPTQRKILAMSEEQMLAEFALIQEKKSNLSKMERDIVVGMFNKSQPK